MEKEREEKGRKLEVKRELTGIEKGEISNILYNYARATTVKRQGVMKGMLFEYIENLIKEGVDR